jgi:hypothetical protein
MAASTREIKKLIDSWHPRGCKVEKDFERSLHKHLENNLTSSEVIMQYASGRIKGDIVVDGKTLIEIKYCLKSTGQLQRLLGQLELYADGWRGKVIVLINGDSQRDLMNSLSKKIENLNQRDFFEEKYFLVLHGAAKPEEVSAWSFWN